VPLPAADALSAGRSRTRHVRRQSLNYLLITSLRRFDSFYGEGFKIECPTGSGIWLSIDEVADELSGRLTRIFRKNANGHRPVHGRDERLQNDPRFKVYLLFHEYFHGDEGNGLGASHQTGWTGLVARLLQPPVISAALKITHWIAQSLLLCQFSSSSTQSICFSTIVLNSN
jgi:hypothetical protein